MDSTMQKEVEIIFQSYNQAIEDGYNHYFESCDNMEVLIDAKDGNRRVECFIKESITQWAVAPIEALQSTEEKKSINV